MAGLGRAQPCLLTIRYQKPLDRQATKSVTGAGSAGVAMLALQPPQGTFRIRGKTWQAAFHMMPRLMRL